MNNIERDVGVSSAGDIIRQPFLGRSRAFSVDTTDLRFRGPHSEYGKQATADLNARTDQQAPNTGDQHDQGTRRVSQHFVGPPVLTTPITDNPLAQDNRGPPELRLEGQDALHRLSNEVKQARALFYAAQDECEVRRSEVRHLVERYRMATDGF